MHTTRYYGPPGTGKTMALLAEFDRELRAGTAPDRIAFVSFTRAARREALTRALDAYPTLSREDFPYIRTLHALCFHALGAHAAVVGDGDAAEFAGLVGMPMAPVEADPALDDFADVRKLYAHVDHFRRARRWDMAAALRHFPDPRLEDWRFVHYCDAWRTYKARRDLLDFTDLLERVVADPSPLPTVEVLIVDEAQDLSPLQWAVVDALCAKGVRRLIVAGDDDQGIYAWAGADPLALVRRPADDSRVLGRSHRLPARFVPLAQRIARPIRGRAEKAYAATRDGGTLRHVSDDHLADAVVGDTSGDVLVLARTRRGVDAHARALLEAGVPFTRADGGAPLDKYREAIIAWGNALVTGWVSAADRRAILPALVPMACRRVGGEDDGRLGDLIAVWKLPATGPNPGWQSVFDGIPPAVAHYLSRWPVPPVPTVRLSTIHAAKGAEAASVYLDVDPRVWDAGGDVHAADDDERRVWYVGATRARESLAFVGYDRNPYLFTA